MEYCVIVAGVMIKSNDAHTAAATPKYFSQNLNVVIYIITRITRLAKRNEKYDFPKSDSQGT